MQNLKIKEIFKSIQGESSFIGLPCTFIRFSGCNLKCSYCDSLYTHKGGKIYSCNDIMGYVNKLNCSLVEITGGEPLLQEGLYNLIDKLLEKKYKILIETNGSLSVMHIPKEVTKIIDLKCPDSRMSDKMDFNNLQYLLPHDEIKFVIKTRRDYNWAKKIICEFSLNKTANILISPVLGEIEPKKIANWILKDNLNVRFQIQLHKVINIK